LNLSGGKSAKLSDYINNCSEGGYGDARGAVYVAFASSK
jgi:hypothetical protein